MMIRWIFAGIAVALIAMGRAFAAAPTPAEPNAVAAPPSAEAFYRRALEQTRGHATPSFATYLARVDGIDCSLEDAHEGVECSLKLSGHSRTKEPLQIAYRSSDDRLALEQQGRSFRFGGPFLNATWK